MMINTEYGQVSGVRHNGCTAYLGIPFAMPPVGLLAFRHPVKPRPWDGVYAAVRGKANPVQTPEQDSFTSRNNSQDCLYLNIFVPDGIPTPAAVMVWIFGGAFSIGGTGQQDDGSLMYDMSRFAVDSQTIVVTLNYRLNVFGFLGLHQLSGRFDVNCGLYDQIMALRFVRDNIAAFGGDPDRITAFGQSAGAASILTLMCMPEAEGLFRRCIIQSACIEHFFTPEESRRNAEMFLNLLGVKCPESLLAMPEDQLVRASQKYERLLRLKGELRCAFSPTVDGSSLPVAPVEGLKEHALPLLIGNTLREGDFFIQSFPAAVLPILARYLRVKVPEGSDSYKQRASDGLTQQIFLEPLERMLRDYPAPVWKYMYRHGENLGHIDELPVLFGMTDDDAGLEMRRVWGQFAKTGELGWPQYGLSHMEYSFY